MSINGLSSYNPLTINGLDTLNIGGDPFDPASYVPYLGATQDVYLQGPVKMFQDYNATSTDLTVVVNRQTLNSAITAARTSLLSSNNTFTGSNDFTTQTTVESLKINSTGAPLQYTLTADAFGQLQIGYVGGPNFIVTNGSDLFATGNINCSTVLSTDAQLSGSQYFSRTSPDEWSISVGSGGEYEIKDDTGTIRLKLSKTAGLTIGNLIATTARFTSITSATPSLALGVDGSGNLNTFPVPVVIDLLPLNNTWTGLNTFNQPVSVGNRLLGATDTSPSGNFWIGLRGSGSEADRLAIALLGDATTGIVDTITLNKKTNVLSTTSVSSKAYLTQSLRTAGMSAMAVQPGIITGGAPWLLTPSPASSPFAACYSPTQTWITGARYIFRFANFSYAVFGMSLIFYQANVGDTGSVPISNSFPFVPGDFTGIFTPNINPGFLGQVYLQFQGTANKTFNWTSFTYEVGTFEVDGAIDMNGIATINGGSNFAVANNYMQTGSLTIGDNTRNYGGGSGWNTNTAGLLMECLDRTEIAVHDAGLRVASLMYYDGPNNTIFMGRDMGWAVSNVATGGNLTVPGTAIIQKTGGNSGTNYFRITGNDAGSSPYTEYFFNNLRRMYVGNANATEALIVAENGALINFYTQGASRMTIDTGGTVNVANTFRKNNNVNPATTYIAMLDGNAANTPYIDFTLNGTRKAYIGYATTTNFDFSVENGARLNFLTNGSTRMIIDTNGNVGIGRSPSYGLDINGAVHVRFDANADDSKTVYGPNATWNAFLTVGSGIDNSGPATAQVLSTNGNLHLDAGNGLDIYYGYYPSSRGTPNTHQFYGTSVNFHSGLPQNTQSFTQVAVFDGVSLRRSQEVHRLVYFNNNVAWGGGVNMVNAFYLYNTACNVQIWGKNSGFYSGAGMMQTTIRCYSQSSGTYYYFPINAFVNVGNNHFTVPLNYASSFPYTGWYDIYVYSTSGWITDGNDQLTIGVTILPAGSF